MILFQSGSRGFVNLKSAARCVVVLLAIWHPAFAAGEEKAWLSYPSGDGLGSGKHVVFVTGEELYRSEESAPMLARLLNKRFGFQTTVLFSVSPKTKNIDPNNKDNIPGIDQVAKADFLVMMLRYRQFPEAGMRILAHHFKAGKPCLAWRTSTHAFAYTKTRGQKSEFAEWDWQSTVWPGGFGQQIVGDTWVRALGQLGQHGTRGAIESTQREHPILRGISQLWGPSPLYAVEKLPSTATLLVRGEALVGIEPESALWQGQPAQPLVWVKDYQLPEGKPGRLIASMIGSAEDLAQADVRRLFLNAILFGCGLEAAITPALDVAPIGEWKPSPSGFNHFRKDRKPSDAGS
jgi:hypothetical protein